MTQIDLGLVTPLIETEHFKTGVLIAGAACSGNEIVAFDGPPGTGKTTTVRHIANKLDRPFVIATMSDKPTPHELLRYIYRGVTGKEPGERARFNLQTETLRAIKDWGGVLLVDELQRTAANSLMELTWLYEESFHAFGLVVAGSGVLTAVKQHPQLATRILGKWEFKPLTGEALISTVTALDPRFAATLKGCINRHDRNFCRGNLRDWIRTLKWARNLKLDGPLTDEQFETIANIMPAWEDDNMAGAAC